MLGYPFLKVKGIYFSILTLLTAETFRLVAYNWTVVHRGHPGPGGSPLAGADEACRSWAW